MRDTTSLLFPSLTQRRRAVAYYRHSAEDKQEFSIPLQQEQARAFARNHDIDIIHEEMDDGKTGLNAKRSGFIALLDDWVQNRAAPAFEYVLVLNVSRWGRFQDQDQSAYYEYICKMHGKQVIYFSRGFPKDEHKLIGHLQTSIERYMAAEYSRQLSDNVIRGCLNVSRQGFSAGGPPCYGMQRVLLDESHKPLRVLQKGEHKLISNQRVTFSPAEDGTSQTVRDIFRDFIAGMMPREIARRLDTDGIPSPSGKQWSAAGIFRILRNESYIGTRMYNKTWNRLKQGRRSNPRQEWVVCPDAFAALIDREAFSRAHERLEFIKNARKKGLRYSQKRATLFILSEIRKFLRNQGFHEDTLRSVQHWFPFTVTASSSSRQWCFLLPRKWRTRECLIGVSVLPHEDLSVDRYFALSPKDFGMGGICIFGERDEHYARRLLSADTLAGVLVSRARNTTGAVFPVCT